MSTKEKEKNRIIDYNKYSLNQNINTNTNISHDKEEIISQIRNLKNELDSKNNLINNLIQEMSKQNTILKDYEILEKEKNQINLQLKYLQNELENFKSLNNKMKIEIEQMKIELSSNQDFNCEDAFRIFEKNNKGTSKNTKTYIFKNSLIGILYNKLHKLNSKYGYPVNLGIIIFSSFSKILNDNLFFNGLGV